MEKFDKSLEIYEYCFSKCITKLKKKPKVEQEYCQNGCMRKVFNSFQFLSKIDQQGGIDRNLQLDFN